MISVSESAPEERFSTELRELVNTLHEWADHWDIACDDFLKAIRRCYHQLFLISDIVAEKKDVLADETMDNEDSSRESGITIKKASSCKWILF